MVALPALADLTGDVIGTITDPSGAAVAGAKVTIKNLRTGGVRVVTTGANGEFSAPQLEIGNYQVTVEKNGFKTLAQSVTVQSGEKTRMDSTLEVGNLTETVTVEAGALPTFDVATAQVSQSLNSEEVLALPNQARDPVAYATLSPGTVPVSINNPFLGVGSFNSNGSRGRANNITLDGVTAADTSTTGESGAAFVQDSIAEVKIITNNFDAEFGRNSGSQVQLITKGGTNSYHGSAYYYGQNSGFGNARGYFTPESGPGSAVTKIVQNQGGGTFGGPIYKDHTFFFGSGEVDRVRGAGQAVIANVLTPAQAAAITDPTSLALFNNNGAFTSPSGSLSESAPNASDADTWTLRVDQLLRGGKDSLFVKYGQSPFSGVTPSLTFISTNLPGFGASNTVTPRDLTVSYTIAINSNLINNFRFGFGRSNPAFPVNSTFKAGPMVIFGDGTSSFGQNFLLPQGRTQNTFQYLDTVSWTKGRHTIKIGVDLNRYQAPSFFDLEKQGVVVFGDIAAFQAGQPALWIQNFGNTNLHNFAFDVFGFVQDDFRVTPTLTLNLGFRLESSGGVSENHQLLANLDPNNNIPLGKLGTGPLGGIDLGGTAFHRNINPGPRLGFAWNPGHGKLVIRGGYGIAYDFIYQNPITNLRFSPPFVTSATVKGPGFVNNSLAALVAGTAPAQKAAIAGIGSFNPNQINFGNFAPVDQNLDNPRNQQYSLGVEYQAAADLVLKVSYVGSHNDHLQVSMPINLVAPGNIPAAPTSLADQNARFAEFEAASNAEIGSAFGPALNSLIDPRFNNVTQVQSIGTSSYNSLQVEAVRRFKNGLTFDANYTWSHSLDDISDALNVLINDSALPLDGSKPISFNRANSQFDIRNRFVLSYNYVVPFTKGFQGWKKYVLDGWSQSGIFSTQSGLPTTVFAAPIGDITDLLLNGTNVGGTVTNTAVDGNATQLHPVPFFPTYAVPNTLPVTEPLLEHNGTSGRNQLRLDGQTNFDAAISKAFKITESKRFEIQYQVFNLLNHPNFAGYQNILGSSQFNSYTSTATNARQMQLAARFFF
jgi:hypothetical protein